MTRRATRLRISCAAFLALLIVGGLQVAVTAQGQGTPTTIHRVLTFSVIEQGCPGGKDPCWDTTLLVANAGDNVTLVADLTPSSNIHNLHVKGITPEQKTTIGPGSYHSVNFTMPSSGQVTFACDLHPTMSGTIVTPAQFAAASKPSEGSDVPELGVHFLSYWVGLISFMVLFVVYGATFFLFKYNETSATTDQWTRAGAGAPESKRRFSPGMASALALLIAAVLIAAIIFLARR